MSISENSLPPDEALREARLLDAVRCAEERFRPSFVGFLTQEQADSARALMNRRGFCNYLLWGGYGDAERVVFGAFPEGGAPKTEEFPIAALTASFRPCDALTHRDFLGALMSEGIARETVGDLLVEAGRAVLFLRAEISDDVLSRVSKIGGAGVGLSPGYREPLPAGLGFTEFHEVIASARLDCVLSAVLRISRGKAAALVASRSVRLNGVPAQSVSAAVGDGDRISVRGSGRFALDRVGPVTKKGRWNLTGRKYN